MRDTFGGHACAPDIRDVAAMSGIVITVWPSAMACPLHFMYPAFPAVYTINGHCSRVNFLCHRCAGPCNPHVKSTPKLIVLWGQLQLGGFKYYILWFMGRIRGGVAFYY